MRDVAERLREAIPTGGIREFHRQIEERGVRGSSYAMVHRYLNGKAVPSLEFLEAAAEILGVRAAWLICGDGERTDAEAAVPHGSAGVGVTELERRLWNEAAVRIAGHSEDGHAVAHALYSAVRRLVGAAKDWDEPDDDRTVRIARALVEMVQEPTRKLMHEPPGARKFADYYLAALHALMLAMPAWQSVESGDEILEKLEA